MSVLSNPRVRDVIGLLARLVLGGVVLVAGLLKVGHLETSARSVRAYQLLPYDVAGYLGYGLPILEVAIGRAPDPGPVHPASAPSSVAS